MITRDELIDQVIETLGDYPDDFDINAIVDEIQGAYGIVHIDAVPTKAYRTIVMQHDVSEQDKHTA